MSDFVFGKNSFNEALNTKRITKAYIVDNPSLIKVLQREHIPFEIVDKKRLDGLTRNGNHQGMVAQVKEYKLSKVEDMLKDNMGLIVILDGIKDPHNLGAIIRTCECAGVDGVIYKKHGAVHLNETVAKVSSGALEYMKVAEVTNLRDTIKLLKERGYWIVGTDGYSRDMYNKIDYKMNVGLVIGSEGEGVSRLIKEECDFMVKMPMYGHITSLNASVAAGIMIYNILDKREG